MAEYTTRDAVEKSYMSPWNPEWDEWVTSNIELVSAMLDQEFQKHGRNLARDLLDGKVNPVLLKYVANSMLHRMLKASDNGMGGSGMDWSQLSASAGGYSFSATPVGSTGSFYIRRDEKKLLGLSALVLGSIDYTFVDQWRDDVSFS